MKTKQELIKERDELQYKIDNYQELNNWYKDTKHKKWMYFKGEDRFFGRTLTGLWSSANCAMESSIEYEVLATRGDVKKMLIEEARDRGFKSGVSFKHNVNSHELIADDVCEIESDDFIFEPDTCGGTLYLDNWAIFRHGYWGTIVEGSCAPMVGGFKASIHGNKIKFGCKSFTTSRVLALYKNMKVLEVNSISLLGYEIYIEELKQIVEYINSKK